MLYASIAIIVAGIMAALAPIVREWHAHRMDKERMDKERKDREKERGDSDRP